MSSLTRFSGPVPELAKIQFPVGTAASAPKLKLVIETYKLDVAFEHMDIFDWLSRH